jgi:hypothetical protein
MSLRIEVLGFLSSSRQATSIAVDNLEYAIYENNHNSGIGYDIKGQIQDISPCLL